MIYNNSVKIFAPSTDIDFSPLKSDGQGRVVSVFLSKSSLKNNFRCPSCGKIAFQYTGEIDFIFDGAIIPRERAEIDILCHRCKVRYRVRSI